MNIKFNKTYVLIGILLGVVPWLTVAVASPNYPENNKTFWNENERGWFWYEVPPVEVIEEEQDPQAPMASSQPADDRAPELIEMEAVKKRIEDLRTIAIINPTKENIAAYAEEQEEAMGRAYTFADTWRRVLWERPDLDYSQKGRPTNNLASKVYDVQRNQQRQANVANLSKTHGLFFYFRSDCPYCHAMAPHLKYIQKRFGIKIVPISLDGKGIPGFENPIPDNGSSEYLNITTVPALFIGKPSTGEMTALGYGIMSMQEIEERIYIATSLKPGQTFNPASQGASSYAIQ